uniref:Uncharacterized protein n=1 Tax=Meloidogyne enterolobii TaxID=390850 RepID=A0A6V7W6R5_MELEN|nr:unnamed protein product [Meloidogyne enterolobii]
MLWFLNGASKCCRRYLVVKKIGIKRIVLMNAQKQRRFRRFLKSL